MFQALQVLVSIVGNFIQEIATAGGTGRVNICYTKYMNFAQSIT